MQAVAKRLRADRRITEVIVEPQQEAELRMQDEFADVALSPSIAEPMASALHLFAVDGLDSTKLAVKLTKEIAAAGSAAPAPCQKPPPTGCGPIEPISLSRDPAAQPPGCTPPKAPDVQPRLVRCGQNIVVTFDSERALNAASTWVESDGRFSDEEYSYSEMVLTVRPGHDAREVADDVLASLPKGATDAHVQGCIALPHPVFSSR